MRVVWWERNETKSKPKIKDQAGGRGAKEEQEEHAGLSSVVMLAQI